MDLNAKVLGKTAVETLRSRIAKPVLMIGSDAFTRGDLARVDCFNFAAAENLSKILNDYLQVPNLKYVFHSVHPTALALPRLGAISLAVLGAAFEAKSLGGKDPLSSWVARHANLKDDPRSFDVTFTTLKARQRKQEQEAKRDMRRRKGQRRDQAHRTRVQRFETRTGVIVQ